MIPIVPSASSCYGSKHSAQQCRANLPSAAAFRTMLSAFIGSVVNGLCSGWLTTFITGWISWLSVIQILIAGAYEAYLAIKAGTNFNAVDAQYHNIAMTRLGGTGQPALGAAAESQPHLMADVESPPQYFPHTPL